MRNYTVRLHVLPARSSDAVLEHLVRAEGVLGASMDPSLTLRVLADDHVSEIDLVALLQDAVAPRRFRDA